jgi:glycolate dehydrogenase iron-sulfur subunit
MSEHHPAASSPIRDVCDYERLFECVHCGLCLEACPTYAVTRAEMDSPRGRIYLMKALAEGRLELDADVARHLDLCLGCRGCETACPSGVHYGALIEKTRAYVEREHRRGLGDQLRRAAVGAIFPYPNRLRALLAPLRALERAGLRPALSKLLPRAMREWLELLPPLSPDSLRAEAASEQAPANAPTVVVHHGCVTEVLARRENVNSERVLAAAGYRVLSLRDTVCCGALDLHAGQRGRALEFARANVRALKQSGADAIISAAAGCSVALAEYGELLNEDPQLAADSHQVGARVTDLATLLLKSPRPLKMRELRCTATYHDACHFAHGLGVRDAPRRVLESIPGVRLVEMAESDMCCGSAGSYNLTEPAMARELARRKAEHIAATVADYVVLANPGCEFQIAAELHRRSTSIRVIHLADFLAMAVDTSA